MELTRVDIADSPLERDRVRLSGEVSYDGSDIRPEWYWFEVAREHADSLTRSGNPWLACLLPLAVTRGEPLRLSLPVDRRLLEGVQQLMHIWRAWYPRNVIVPIEAEPYEDGRLAVEGRESGAWRTAAFFSGGVDSFYTLLRPRTDAPPLERAPIDDMLSVWGFDVPLRHREAIARLRTRFQGVASDLGKDFVDVSTNLRCTRWSETDWPYLAHGCALAAVGLALERRYDRVLIAATGGYRDLHPWGSHPLTDPLLSTTSTTLVHDGAGFTRVQKTELLVTSEVARGALRVCWRSESDENCGECNKCYRTALILELLGALGRCSTFPNESVDLGRAGRVYCAQPWDFREFRDIRALALRVGRPDIAKAATRSMQRSPRLMRRLALARALRGRRGLRYLGERLERELRAGWIE